MENQFRMSIFVGAAPSGPALGVGLQTLTHVDYSYLQAGSKYHSIGIAEYHRVKPNLSPRLLPHQRGRKGLLNDENKTG